ncbi:MAG: hypothetical protein BSOLF_0801 [Candidatus Carbobacillus altaicus]|uniref:Uncharacterized protein n=1 Tax=Candidatus Carbonibacillus altaicus TaxID=2163959 RepID=A0A2R6XX98_9BACL|nr:MAG: hypothetical protein BSOLF_0801 [Candidatus Carbobacillus altaicus]
MQTSSTHHNIPVPWQAWREQIEIDIAEWNKTWEAFKKDNLEKNFSLCQYPKIQLSLDDFVRTFWAYTDLINHVESKLNVLQSIPAAQQVVMFITTPYLATLRMIGQKKALETWYHVGIRLGMYFSMENIGLHAINLAELTKKPRIVKGLEHSCRFFHDAWSIGIPLHNHEGEIIAYLGLMGSLDHDPDIIFSYLYSIQSTLGNLKLRDN